jgi:hypothetical protein
MWSMFMGTYCDENKGQRPFPPTHSHSAIIRTTIPSHSQSLRNNQNHHSLLLSHSAIIRTTIPSHSQSLRNNQNVITNGSLSETDVGTLFSALQKLHFTSVRRNARKDKRDIKTSQKKLVCDKVLSEARPRIWRNDIAVGHFGI